MMHPDTIIRKSASNKTPKGASAPRVTRIPSKISIPTTAGLYLVKWKMITHCSGDGNYCRIYLNSGQTLMVSKTLRCVENVLPTQHFLRVHKSHLVQIDCIEFVGHSNVTLETGKNLPLSRTRRHELLDRLAVYGRVE